MWWIGSLMQQKMQKKEKEKRKRKTQATNLHYMDVMF